MDKQDWQTSGQAHQEERTLTNKIRNEKKRPNNWYPTLSEQSYENKFEQPKRNGQVSCPRNLFVYCKQTATKIEPQRNRLF